MHGRRGIAQLVVLWALLLLGVMAMSFAFSMRTEALAARNSLDSTRAYYQARTGINRAVASLSSISLDNVLKAPPVGKEEDASFETRIESEGGKIDINFVSEEMLKEVLKNGGLSPEEAESVGDAILDWRDEDDMPGTNGAESAYYASLANPVKPRNGKLRSVDELLSVKGVTPEIFGTLLSRIFTVHGFSASLDINSAPVEVLRVLPGFTPKAAEAVIAQRRETPFRSAAEVARLLAEEGIPATALPIFSFNRSSRVYTITAVGKADDRIVRGIRCMVEIAGTGPKLVKILRWVDYASVGGGT
ncbi:MAG: type II secretion system protein GspK [Deltaproteobacteria bacterium]|nr:type II secretion system protein GspK [Deltaproteobacteria bacterium]